MTPEPREPGPSPRDPYEFNAEQNALLLALGGRMTFVGFFILGLGVAAAVAGALKKDAGPLLYGLVNLIVGAWTARAGGQFQGIARTQGKDLLHLMAALGELRKLYDLQYWVCLAALVGLLILVGASYVY